MWQTPVINYFKLVENYERQFKPEFIRCELSISVTYACTSAFLNGFDWMHFSLLFHGTLQSSHKKKVALFNRTKCGKVNQSYANLISSGYWL